MPGTSPIPGRPLQVMTADLASDGGATPGAPTRPCASGDIRLTILPRANAHGAQAPLAPLAPCAYFTDHAPDGVVHLIVDYMDIDDFLKLVKDAGLARALEAVIDLPHALPFITARTDAARRVAEAQPLWDRAIAAGTIRDARLLRVYATRDGGMDLRASNAAMRLVQASSLGIAGLACYATRQAAEGPEEWQSVSAMTATTSWLGAAILAGASCGIFRMQQDSISRAASQDMEQLRGEFGAADMALRMSIRFRPRGGVEPAAAAALAPGGSAS